MGITTILTCRFHGALEGKSTYTFELPDGHQVKGHDLQQQCQWPWRSSKHMP